MVKAKPRYIALVSVLVGRFVLFRDAQRYNNTLVSTLVSDEP